MRGEPCVCAVADAARMGAGALLYEMLHNRVAFNGVSEQQLHQRIRAGKHAAFGKGANKQVWEGRAWTRLLPPAALAIGRALGPARAIRRLVPVPPTRTRTRTLAHVRRCER